MPSQQKLAEFVAWVKQHLAGDEKGEAQLYLERLFQAFGHAGLKEAGAKLGFSVARTAVLALIVKQPAWKSNLVALRERQVGRAWQG